MVMIGKFIDNLSSEKVCIHHFLRETTEIQIFMLKCNVNLIRSNYTMEYINEKEI